MCFVVCFSLATIGFLQVLRFSLRPSDRVLSYIKVQICRSELVPCCRVVPEKIKLGRVHFVSFYPSV